MNKKFARIMSMVLLVAMMLSMSVFASAEETEANAEIFAIGDSVVEAWGYDDFYFCEKVANELGYGDARYIPAENIYTQGTGSYEDIVSANRVYYGNAGVRTYEGLIALGAAELDPTDPYYTAVSGEGIWMAEEAAKNSAGYIEAAKAAKTIIIETGSDDVLYYAQMRSGLLDALGDIGNMGVEDITGLLGNYAALLAEGYNNFCKQYPALIERIIELKASVNQTINEDYNIVMVGAYNPVRGLTITDDMVAPVGDAVSAISMAMNVKFREWEKTYGCQFADISNVETGAMTGVNSSLIAFATVSTYDSCIATHPSHPQGYDYIARQVLAQLENAKKPDTNIRIDLGPVTKVVNVTLGSINLPKDRYSFDPETHILTVKNGTPFASSLTVIGMNGNNKLGLYVYQLKYDVNHGYTPYLAYQNANMSKTAVTLLKTFGTITSTVANTISGFFAK